ncbi:MAG: DUF2007 domain-containing protein [Muribaculaceae bacterium]|nr:DUF2007 domain-containing protein [Muribaculaceae bacterium]
MKQTPDDIVLCAQFQELTRASIARDVLLAEGIPAVIDNSVMGIVFPPAGAVRLMVRVADRDRAREILRQGALLR